MPPRPCVLRPKLRRETRSLNRENMKLKSGSWRFIYWDMLMFRLNVFGCSVVVVLLSLP